MKQLMQKPLLFILGAALVLPATLLAQQGEKEKAEKDKVKSEGETIIINRKANNKDKVVVEVNGDKVTVNGKPLEDYKGGDVTVRRSRSRDVYAFGTGNGNWNMSGLADGMTAYGDAMKLFNIDSNRAMLGVTTEKADKGVEVQDVTKESAAEKAGIREGDVITRIDDKKIETPDDLSAAIKAHKPGDKVGITYFRDDKEQKATAELGKWKGFSILTPGYKMNLENFDMGKIMPRIEQTLPRMRGMTGQAWNWSGGGPKLGLSVQDTDDGKGVKVIEVDDESNAAKAGIKEDDLITEVEGKTVNSADDVAKIIRESKEKTSVMFKLTRGGKTQNIEVKIPRRLKTADL